MLKIRQARREQVASGRECPLEVISFDGMEKTDHRARLLDVSITGAGVWSDDRIERGLVWFSERVNGHKSGRLVWCRQHGEYYRAGIKFMPLSREHEDYVHAQLAASYARSPVSDPENIIRKLIEKARNEAEGNA